MNNTIATFPYPTLAYDCVRNSLDKKVAADIDGKMWALGGDLVDGRIVSPKDEYVNDLGTAALKGIGAATAKKLAASGVSTVRDFAYAPRELVTSLVTGEAQRAAIGRLHDAMRTCVGGDVWIQ